MISLLQPFALGGALVALLGANVAVDAGVALRTNVLTALAGTSSFEIDVTNPQGITGTITYLPQSGRVKVQGSGGPHTLVLYAVGDYEYQQYDGSSWQRRKLPPGGLVISPLAATATVVPEPDKKTAAGEAVGAFSATTSLAVPGIGTIPNVAMDCTYDKATLLLRTCTSQLATFVFTRYNDPKIVVDLPPDTKNATELPPLVGGMTQGK
jgi:hypothetical protein